MPPLSPQQLREFLSQPIIARLATSRDSQPYIVPLWFHWDGEAFYLIARARSRYVEDIRSNPKVALSIAQDTGELDRVLVLGQAEIVEGPATGGRWVELARLMARRYFGEADGEAYFARTAAEPRYLIRIVPESMTTWQGRGQWHRRYRTRPGAGTEEA